MTSAASSKSDCAGSPRVSPGARILIFGIEVYRVTLSPILGGHCRFEPSCSIYAKEALRRHGAGRGSWLTLRRILRCQPFSTPGLDPVP
jgi:putative membrane protein insertion efficiency factor